MPGLYLLGLCFGLAGMTIIDARWRLFLWRSPWRAAAVLAFGIAFFLVWDLLGIARGIFFEGANPYLIGVDLWHEVPVEELFFLALLCESTMVLVSVASRVAASRAAVRG
jgi:lycopene cyclase domain-containing protein